MLSFECSASAFCKPTVPVVLGFDGSFILRSRGTFDRNLLVSSGPERIGQGGRIDHGQTSSERFVFLPYFQACCVRRSLVTMVQEFP